MEQKMPKGQSTKRCHCGERSLPGLKKGWALCAYHWAIYQWGKAWADKCHPERTAPNV